MKRLITFAMAAILFGVFSLSANAQIVKGDNTGTKPVVKNQTEAVKTTVKTAETDNNKTILNTPETTIQIDEKVTKTEDWDKVIKDYEISVGQCLNIYNTLKSGKDDKTLAQQFTDSLTKVESLGSKIEKALPELNRTQIHRYNEAKQKLSVVYQKG